MGEKRPCHRFCRAGLTAVFIGMVLILSGCDMEAVLWQILEETIGEEGGRQIQLTLEEVEEQTQNQTKERDDPQNDADASEEDETADQKESFVYPDGFHYAYERLSENEKIWYADMEYAIGTMTDKVKLSEAGIEAGMDEKMIDRIFQCLLNDHPELFYVEGYTYTKYIRGEKTVAIEFSGTYPIDIDTVRTRKEEIENAVDSFLAQAPDTSDDYEKVRYVYEKLIADTEYDLKSEDNQNIYSVFINHSSVCQGYSKAAQYLLNRMGIECTLVQGKIRETGEGHAWNLVKLNGEYYYMDTTWGDISYQTADPHSGEGFPQVSYDYLCITTQQLLRTHDIGALVEMPVCNARKDNYYVREGAVFTDYDKEQLRKLVDAAREQNRRDIALQCADEECYRKMSEALLDRQEIFDYLEGNGVRSFAYTANDTQWTLTFFMVTSNR